MEFFDLLPYLVSFLTALISGIMTFFLSKKNFKEDLIKAKEQNKFEIEKLMNQHTLDISAIEKKHQMETEAREKEHTYQIELMQKEHENLLIRSEKEIEDTAKFGMIQNLMGNIVNDSLSGIINDKMKEELKKAFDKQQQ